MTTFAALAALRREAADLGVGQAAILRKLDELLRCQAVIAKKVAHLHSDNAHRRKVRK